MEMDGLFKERENLNISIVQSINTASEAWGIQCMRYEIRDIKLPEKIQDAMQMQVIKFLKLKKKLSQVSFTNIVLIKLYQNS